MGCTSMQFVDHFEGGMELSAPEWHHLRCTLRSHAPSGIELAGFLVQSVDCVLEHKGRSLTVTELTWLQSSCN